MSLSEPQGLEQWLVIVYTVTHQLLEPDNTNKFVNISPLKDLWYLRRLQDVKCIADDIYQKSPYTTVPNQLGNRMYNGHKFISHSGGREAASDTNGRV